MLSHLKSLEDIVQSKKGLKKNEKLKNMDRKIERINALSNKLQICKKILVLQMNLLLTTNFPVDRILVSQNRLHLRPLPLTQT